MPSSARSDDAFEAIPSLPLSYDAVDSHASALRLIHALRPDWDRADGEIVFERFTEGITNTVGSRQPVRERRLMPFPSSSRLVSSGPARARHSSTRRRYC